MKKRKGYVSLEITIIVFCILTAGIAGIIHFNKEGKQNYSHVEQIEEQIFEQVAYTPWHPSGGGGHGGSGGSGGPGGSEGGSEATYYTIAFDGNGGSHTTRDVEIGQPVGNLPVSVRNGYTFMGWYDSASGGNKVTKDTIPTANTVYYAHWTPTQYKISYDLNGGSVVNPGSYTLESDTFTLGKPTKQYYEFIGWTGSNGTVPMLEVTIEKGSTGEKQYVANYIPNAYTVVYSETDSSLSFYNLNENIVQGKEFNGKMSTNVYMISKDEIFSSENLTPWCKDHATDIKYVDVIEEIQPRNTAYWFYGLTNCSVFDLNKLNTVNTVDMSYMFKDVASNVRGVRFGEINQYTGDKLELNEYGFFYDVTYKATIPGYDAEMQITIHSDGSADFIEILGSETYAEQYSSSQMYYTDGIIIAGAGTGYETPFCIVENGFALQMDDLNFVIDYEKYGYRLQEPNENGFYYNANYTYREIDAEEILLERTFVFKENGDIEAWENGVLLSTILNKDIVYNQNTARIESDGVTLVFKDNGTKIEYDTSTYALSFPDFSLELSSIAEYTGLEFTNLSNKLTLETPNAVKMESMFEGCTTITDLDLSNFDMTKATVTTNMFKNMLRLQEITFGENWKWIGTDGYLPTPDSKYIKGADGNWYDLNDNPYISNKVPNGEGTYVAGGKNEYAVFSMDDYSLSFYNTRKEIKVGDIYNGKLANAVYTDFIEDEVNTLSDDSVSTYIVQNTSQWASIASQVLKVYVVDEISPINTSFWFADFINCELFDIQKLNMEKVVDAQWMFAHAEKTTELNVSHWKLENLEIAWRMFGWCNGLTELDLSEFTGGPNLIDISYMFADSANLKKIDLSNLDASAVTDADYMFDGLNYLEEITFGPKWKFINKRGYLPTPSSTYIPNANGCWYSEDGTTYTPSTLATAYNADRAGMAGTYYAVDLSGTAYALVHPDENGNTILTFTRSKTPIGIGDEYEGQIIEAVYTDFENNKTVPWSSHAESITKVNFAHIIKPISTSKWFNGFKNCLFIDNIKNLITSDVQDMSYMFQNCNNLETLDVSNFNTSNVKDMQYMFSSCSKLTTIDVSKFDTNNVKNMQYMFAWDAGITDLDVSNFDTANVTNMYAFLAGCESLTSLNKENHTGLDIRSKTITRNDGTTYKSWNTGKVTNMQSFFYNCKSLTSLDLNHFDTSNVTNMVSVFQSCSNLTSIKINEWDTSSATRMRSMFNSCSSLTSLDVRNFDTSNVFDMYCMFINDSSLQSLDLSTWNTSRVDDMGQMFDGCSSLETLDLSGWDTSNVTNRGSSGMAYIFRNCKKLKDLDVSHFNTSNMSSFVLMFSGCSSLTSLDLSKWDTSNIESFYHMFSHCANLEEVNISTWDTSSLKNVAYMFTNSPKIKTEFTMFGNPTDYGLMFNGAATDANAQISIRYTSESEEAVDKMLTTKSTNSNVVKVGEPLSSYTVTVSGNEDFVVNKPVAYVGQMVKVATINGEVDATSFKVNGVEVIGNSFIMPEENVVITDIYPVKRTISIINDDGFIPVNLNESIGATTKAYPGTKIYIVTSTLSTSATSFKLNGVEMTGYTFIMPDEDVVITDILPKKHNITIKGNDAVIAKYGNIGYTGEYIILSSIDGTTPVTSFKVNGVEVVGDRFKMPDEDVVITDILPNAYSITINGNDAVKTNIGSLALPGQTVELASGEIPVTSFKLNGEEITGNTFVMPEENVVITDVLPNAYSITINGNNSIISSTGNSALVGQTVELNPCNGGTEMVLSFKMNGTYIEGNTFIMPDGNAVITDIETTIGSIIQSEHYGYPAGLIDKVYGEVKFDGATSLTITLESQILSVPDYGVVFDWIYLYDSPDSVTPLNNKKYGGINIDAPTLEESFITETITIPGDYVKITFTTGTEDILGDLYGFKATIIPNY